MSEALPQPHRDCHAQEHYGQQPVQSREDGPNKPSWACWYNCTAVCQLQTLLDGKSDGATTGITKIEVTRAAAVGATVCAAADDAVVANVDDGSVAANAIRSAAWRAARTT